MEEDKTTPVEVPPAVVAEVVVQEQSEIELYCHGLPQFLGKKDWIEFLNTVPNFKYVKAKRFPNTQYAMVTIQNKDDFNEAKIALESVDVPKTHGKKLEVSVARNQKRKHESKIDTFEKLKSAKKKSRTESGEAEQTIEDVSTPYHSMPYTEQLAKKQKDANKTIVNITKLIKVKSSYRIPSWCDMRNKQQPCCELLPILPCPQINDYRNKSSFTVGLEEDGSVSVGLSLGRVSQGMTVVKSPKTCKHISVVAKEMAAQFEDFLKKHPQWKVYDKITNEGNVRQLMVRNNREGDVMLVIQIKGDKLTPEELAGFNADVIKYFDSLKNDKIKSIYVQQHNGVSNCAPADLPCELIAGEQYLTEEVLGLKFRIHANSFFQTNTLGAEVLYSTVKDWASVEQGVVLVDICCGTGTIGLIVKKNSEGKIKKLIGVELVESAVKDARQNAQDNDVQDVQFIAGKAENELKRLDFGKDNQVVGVVNPPRAGLHNGAVKAIRQIEGLDRLIYVSCNQKSLAVDAAELCREKSKTMEGAPFKPIKAVAVDMFPHTEHCEMVMLFERCK